MKEELYYAKWDPETNLLGAGKVNRLNIKSEYIDGEEFKDNTAYIVIRESVLEALERIEEIKNSGKN